MPLKQYEEVLEDVWRSLTTSSPEVAMKLLMTFAIFLLLWLLRKVVLQFIHRRSDNRLLDSAHSITAVFFYLILAFVVVRIWFEGLANFLTYIGLVAAGLTIVCKELILNFVAMWVIAWRDLFSHGDRIQVGDYIGDVTRKGPLYFTLVEVGNWVDADQSTGRTVRMPNSLVLSTPVANYSKGVGYLWNELSVVVQKDSDWERARELLLQAVKDFYAEFGAPPSAEMHDDHEFVFYKKTTPKVYMRVAEGGVKLTLRYLCKPKRRRDSENHIWATALRTFGKSGITINY